MSGLLASPNKRRRSVLGAALVAGFGISLTMAGCSVADPTREPTTTPQSPSKSPSTTPSSAVTAAPTSVEGATCSTLLSGTARSRFVAAGLHEDSVTWAADQLRAPAAELFQYVAEGALLCDWTNGTTIGFAFAYGPMDSAKAEDVEAKLTDQGIRLVGSKSGLNRYANSDRVDLYAFGQGHWAGAFATGNGGRLDSVTLDQLLDDVIANAPGFH